MQDDHDSPRAAPHELIHAFRQLRQIPWNNRNPIENCTQAETMMLFFIRRATRENPTGVKASELSSMLNVASPTVTQSVNLLVAKGLLQRSADPHDRRASRITLTEEGARLTGLAHEAMHARMTALSAHLGDGRASQLVKLLHDVYDFFQGLDEGVESGTGPWCRPGSNASTTPKEGE